ncbi:hypothetical protein CR513_46502, partial [Mucuna pruriens]
SVLHLAETKSDKSLPRPHRLSFYREQLGQCQDESILYTSDSTSKIEKPKIVKRGPLGLPTHSGGSDPQSSTDPLYDLDIEIELTLCRLKKTRNIVVSNSSNSISNKSIPSSDTNSPVTNNSDSVEYNSTNSFARQMENNERTRKELATPDVVYQPWCIQYPQLEPAQTYELKFGFIHLLPKFHGLAGEDPHKHLKEFHVVCSIMRLQGISEDYIKMKAFPFSLDGAAKDWLYL